MNRRTYLTALGGTLSIAAAGCTESDDSGGGDGGGGDDDDDGEEQVLDELVFGDGIFNFEADAGDELRVTVDNEQGSLAVVDIGHIDTEEDLLTETVETTDEFTATVETDGAHRLFVNGERVAVAVFRS